MERKIVSIGAVRIRAGKYYCTEGGCLAFIHRVKGNVAHGFIVQGHLFKQWHLNGKVITNEADIQSDYNIINEVTDNENWYPSGNTQRNVSCG